MSATQFMYSFSPQRGEGVRCVMFLYFPRDKKTYHFVEYCDCAHFRIWGDRSPHCFSWSHLPEAFFEKVSVVFHLKDATIKNFHKTGFHFY
ncbi:MAG: hypothetical protein L3J04_11605, partial [Robiginitomaculum sp.]|nr:hypothetical protein [Robiginitomaculum sp.]